MHIKAENRSRERLPTKWCALYYAVGYLFGWTLAVNDIGRILYAYDVPVLEPGKVLATMSLQNVFLI